MLHHSFKERPSGFIQISVRYFARALSDVLAMQKPHVIIWLPFIMACGIGFYFALPNDPPSGPVLLIATFPALIVLTIYNYTKSIGWRYFLIFYLIFVLGFLAAQHRTMTQEGVMLTRAHGPAMIEATISAIEVLEKGNDRRLLLSDPVIEDLSAEQTPAAVRLRYRGDVPLEVGQRISALVELMPLSGPFIPGGFDFRRYFYFQGIGAVGFIYRDVRVLETQGDNWGVNLRHAIESVRTSVSEKIYAALEPRQASVVAALMIGRRAGISEPDQEAIRTAGLAHMLAISGLHVGLFSGVLFFAARFAMAAFPGFAIRHPIKKYAALIALAGAVFYMLLAGATIPTQRAVLMTGVVLVAIMLDRSAISLRLVALAAFLILLLSPDSLISASFQMSFAAVTALVVFYEKTRGLWMRAYRQAGFTQKAMLYFAGLAATTIVASFATAPFALYHFNKFATYSLMANMLAMPVLGFAVMPAAVLSLFTMPFGLSGWPLQIMGAGVGLILDISHLVTSWPGALMRVAQIPFPAFISLIIALYIFLFLRGPIRYSALLLLCLAGLFWIQARLPSVMLSDTHALTAFYDPEDRKLYIDEMRKESFVRENWLRALGLDEDDYAPLNSFQNARCDSGGCRIVMGGVKIALLESPETHIKGCSWADLVIARDPVKIRCRAQVLDRFDSWARGAHAVFMDPEEKILIIPSEPGGKRPWSRR